MNDCFEWNAEKFIADLSRFVDIPSVRDEASARIGAPFGKAVQRALEEAVNIGVEQQLIAHRYDGYAVDLRTGEGENYIGVLCHADVVPAEPAQWTSDPYHLARRGNFLYGRGVNDDKGPLVLLIHVLSQLKRNHPNLRPIRLIIGGAEETTWEGVKHYFSLEKQPMIAFSPDGDFPIVNHEKGILKVRIHFPYRADPVVESLESKVQELYTCEEVRLKIFGVEKPRVFTGKRALSRHPERGTSALAPMLEAVEHFCPDSEAPKSSFQQLCHCLRKYFSQIEVKKIGEKASIENVTITVLSANHGAGKTFFDVDFRYETAKNEPALVQDLQKMFADYNATVEVLKFMPLLFVQESDPFLQNLVRAYETVTGEQAYMLKKGGASYARALERGVCFGPTFPGEIPNSHLSDEVISLASFEKAAHIYYEALKQLAVEKE